MFGYIYKITNIITNKVYIGKHKYSKPELDPNYITSGVYIQNSIDLYGIDNFIIELVDIADDVNELNNKEIYYIESLNTKYPNGYNLTNGGDGLSDPSKPIREKMAKSKLGTKRSKESIDKARESLKKVVHTEEWVDKIRESNRGKRPSDITLQRSSEVHKGSSWYNDGVVEIMLPSGADIPSGFVKGRLKNPFPSSSGIKKSPETINKISEKKRGTVWVNNGIVEKMVYVSNGIPDGFVLGRIKRK